MEHKALAAQRKFLYFEVSLDCKFLGLKCLFLAWGEGVSDETVSQLLLSILCCGDSLCSLSFQVSSEEIIP